MKSTKHLGLWLLRFIDNVISRDVKEETSLQYMNAYASVYFICFMKCAIITDI